MVDARRVRLAREGAAPRPRRGAAPLNESASILRRYRGGGPLVRLYRRLRLRHAGLEPLAARFPDAGRVVDLGCGEGLFAHLLSDLHPGLEVVAVDADARRIARVRRSAEGRRIQAVEAGMEDYEIPPCQGVVFLDVLHYLGSSEQLALLDRACAALTERGVLLLRDPDAGAGPGYWTARLHERICVGLGWTWTRPGGGSGTYRRGTDWARLLEERGLKTTVERLPRWPPYADRVVWGRKP